MLIVSKKDSLLVQADLFHRLGPILTAHEPAVNSVQPAKFLERKAPLETKRTGNLTESACTS